jgi:hypothetical protein
MIGKALSAVLIVGLAMLALPFAVATEIQPGVVYDGGTRLSVAEYGVSFTIPAGWKGALPQGSEYFVIEPLTGGATILAIGDQGSVTELQAILSAPIQLGGGVMLQPSGTLRQEGGALVREYSVSGTAQPLVARVAGRADDSGFVVVFGLLAPADQLASHRAAFDQTVGSTSFAPPVGAGGSVAGGAVGQSGQQATGSQQTWAEYLRGKYIVRYYTATGYTDETHLWLCSDGTFQRRGAAGGFGGGASGAFQGDSTGRWQATGVGANGTLDLLYGDGSSVRHVLYWDYDKNELHIDNKRWLHDTNRICD